MRPKRSQNEEAQGQLWKTDLEKIIDLGHPMVKMAEGIDWGRLDAAFGESYVEGKGRPAIPTRLMVALHYIKFTFDLSDDEVVQGWRENVYWQWLSGMRWFEHGAPIDPSSMSRWRRRIEETGAMELLKETIAAGLEMKLIKRKQLEVVNVDTTVQEKNVRYPTDARLYHRSIEKLTRQAKKDGVRLKRTYKRVSKLALFMQSRYAHTRKPAKAAAQTRKLRTLLGRVRREIERGVANPSGKMRELLEVTGRIEAQERGDKRKVYSVHEPHVECISKGKAHKKWEFGCKVSVVVSSRGGWITGAQAFHGTPYDGHTLQGSLDRAAATAGVTPGEAHTDKGYRKHGYKGETQVHVDKTRRGDTPKPLWKRMKRRAAVEPTIGHLKSDHRLDCNRLKGPEGDLLNIVFAAIGKNFAKLLRLLCALIFRRLMGVTAPVPLTRPCPSFP